ncbi:MAG: hypothetical protein IJZ42_06565 [Lachnospiraceae bacterium]|nr:hypothetical protein [Lachnospiraceae bacterium]
MKKIRLLPAFVTLLAGAITSITLYILNVETYFMLLVLLAVLIIFYVLGVIAMKIIMDCPPKEKEDEEEGEGEVIEKDDKPDKDVVKKTS